MKRFWYDWPSWLVEVVAGMALQSVLLFGGGILWREVAAGMALSLGYELLLDQNGWSWRDVGQRAVGQAVVAVLRAIL